MCSYKVYLFTGSLNELLGNVVLEYQSKVNELLCLPFLLLLLACFHFLPLLFFKQFYNIVHFLVFRAVTSPNMRENPKFFIQIAVFFFLAYVVIVSSLILTDVWNSLFIFFCSFYFSLILPYYRYRDEGKGDLKPWHWIPGLITNFLLADHVSTKKNILEMLLCLSLK